MSGVNPVEERLPDAICGETAFPLSPAVTCCTSAGALFFSYVPIWLYNFGPLREPSPVPLGTLLFVGSYGNTVTA